MSRAATRPLFDQTAESVNALSVRLCDILAHLRGGTLAPDRVVGHDLAGAGPAVLVPAPLGPGVLI